MKRENIISRICMLFIIGFFTFQCTDAELSKFGGLGDEFTVEMINCDGSVARTWTSTGKVLSENGSDGYYFQDKETGKLIEVTGRLIITKK